MKSQYINGNVRAHCDLCDGTVTTFEKKDATREFGNVIVEGYHSFDGSGYSRIIYFLLKCAGCGRGGLAKIHDDGRGNNATLESFLPSCITRADIPHNVPEGIALEYREAENCMSIGAWRGASALLRSTLEKILKANGYTHGKLYRKIEEASEDGIITESRRKKAHDDIRVLGNDVLHEEWREIDEDETSTSHHYVQRILEDFYDDRESVEKILIERNRISEGNAETIVD